ncbi:MAG: MFS transporter [Candidatus Hadarchaeum sp.]|uniref:MFS transporter n=1 Tax=Candidatus Hadarchaeum sp. TaxID=2883567 RepID=UPI003D128EAB
MRGRWLPLSVMTFAHFFNDFFQFILPLFLPLFIPEFGLSYFESGVLLGVYLGSAVVLNGLLGHLADKHHKRKPLMCFGLALYGISVSALQFAQDYTSLLILAVIMGIGFSSYHPQATKIITSLYPDHKGRFMGIHGAGGAIGFFASPLLLTPLAYSIGWRPTVSLLFLPACFAALLLWMVVKEPEPGSKSSGGKILWWPIILLGLVYGLSLFVFRGFTNFMPVYFYSVQGNTAIEMGLLSSLVWGMGVIAEPLGGTISDYIGRRNTFTISLLLLAFSLLCFINTSGPLAIVFLILFGFFGQSTRCVGLLYSSELAPPESTGMFVGLVFGMSQGLSLISTVAVGYAADLFGFHWAFTGLVAVALVATALSLRMRDFKTKQNH